MFSTFKRSSGHFGTLGGAALGILLVFGQAWALEGTVRAPDQSPIPGAFCALMNESHAPLSYGSTNGAGDFALDWHEDGKLLVVVPPRHSAGPGVHHFDHHPRVFEVSEDAANLKIEIPQAINYILHGYNAEGKLLLWEDYAAMGTLGGQFVHATDMHYQSIPATRWHVPRPDAAIGDDSRERSLPTVLLEPGAPAALEVLFWETQGYGKLLLRLDNGGRGFPRDTGGSHRVLEVNVELARTAAADLLRRAAAFPQGAQPRIQAVAQAFRDAEEHDTAIERAAAADAVLVAALALRDELEIARAMTSAPHNAIVGLDLNEAEGPWEYTLELLKPDFRFGVYEGAPYHELAWETARKGGFDLATVLLGWNWTQYPDRNRGNIERQYGIPALEKLGYDLKAHGMVWVQEHPIMPQKAFDLSHDELRKAKLEHATQLLEVFGDRLHIFENINEPANTNAVGLSREAMGQLAADSANLINAATGKPVLVNSPHEFTHGWQFVNYTLDGKPVDHFPRSFSAYLEEAAKKNQLDDVDIIGLQVYPGGRFETPPFTGLDTPAYTPSRIFDLLEAYSRFGKALHITEFSLPSGYEDDWRCGYWKAPWTEVLQAEFAEAVFAIAYAHPQTRSISWWDISDLKPSVSQGGLLRRDGTPKPAFERLSDFIQSRHGRREGILEEAAEAIAMPSGEYHMTLRDGNGTARETTFRLLEGFRLPLSEADFEPVSP